MCLGRRGSTCRNMKEAKMGKSTRTVKAMPKGYAYPVGKPAGATHGTAKEKAAPPYADHGSALDKTIPRPMLFPKG